MPIRDINVTREDLDHSGWEGIIATCAKKEYSAYFDALKREADTAAAGGDVVRADALYLLAAATILWLSEDNNQPFKPMMVTGNERTTIPGDFTDEQLDLFAALAPTVQDAELRARLADLLWVSRRDYRMAQAAVDAYIASARVLEDPDQWPPCIDRIRRAQQIAASLGRKGPLPTVVAFIEELLLKYNGGDPSFFSCKLMEFLLEMRQGDSAVYAAVADTAARQAEGERNWWRAQAYLEVLARWHARAQDVAQEQAAWRRYAETYAQEAEEARRRPTPSHGVAAHFLQQAIEAFRNRVHDSKERQQELHKLLLDYQQRAVTELKPMSVSEEITEMVERVEQAVSGMPLLDALFTLAFITRPPNMQRLAEQAERHANSFISRMFPRVLLNDRGKVVARQPAEGGDEDEAVTARRADMLDNAAQWHNLIAQGIVWPAVQQIAREHVVNIADLLPLVRDNPFVPLGREGIMMRGLHAGLAGDFLVSTHLLAPQIENAIRTLLIRAGAITSGLTSEGIQNELSLNDLLEMPELSRILDADMIFDLQGLLVEHHGSNLRNLVAHGLLNYGAFSTGQAIYLWWIALRLCSIPVLNGIHEEQRQPDDVTANRSHIQDIAPNERETE